MGYKTLAGKVTEDHNPAVNNPGHCFWTVIWVLGALLLTGCGSLRVPDAPTLVPTEYLPTMIALTIESKLTEDGLPATAVGEATLMPTNPLLKTATWTPEKASPTAELVEPIQTPTPAYTATPLPTTATPGRITRTPTLMPTLNIPEADIQIRQPGPMSKVTSPFTVSGSIKPGSQGHVRLELLGEDGRLLVRKLINYRTDVGRAGLSEEVDYEISAVAEAGRLQVSTYDRFGRIESFSSVDLILLSIGEADLNPPGPLTEPIIVQEPLPNKLIQGGKVFVSGLARVSSEQPLLIEMIASDGSIPGYRQAGVTVDPEGGYTPFMVEIPYQVIEPTWVRLTVKEMSSGRIQGLVQLTSLEVLLSP